MVARFPITNLSSLLEGIVQSIQKAVGPDVKEQLAMNRLETNNYLMFYRTDKINDNLRNLVVSDTVELKHFKRYAWTGCLLIDRVNKVTISICTKGTFDRIMKMRNRSIPHYQQTLLFIQNGDLEAPVKQMSLADYEEYADAFTEDEFIDDYRSIMGDEIGIDDGYRHSVVLYETSNFEVSSIVIRFPDKDLDTVEERSLMDMLHPNFADLTDESYDEPERVGGDVHTLVSVKKPKTVTPSVEIKTKKEEEEKQV